MVDLALVIHLLSRPDKNGEKLLSPWGHEEMLMEDLEDHRNISGPHMGMIVKDGQSRHVLALGIRKLGGFLLCVKSPGV
jgi:hypothetical protein